MAAALPPVLVLLLLGTGLGRARAVEASELLNLTAQTAPTFPPPPPPAALTAASTGAPATQATRLRRAKAAGVTPEAPITTLPLSNETSTISHGPPWRKTATMMLNSEWPLPLQPVPNCYLAPLRAGEGCELLDTAQGAPFELNTYGQETTGKRRCLERMRRGGGDSFVFAVGWCQIWRCGSRGALRASAGPDAGPPLPDSLKAGAVKVAFRSHFGGYLATNPDQEGMLHSWASDISGSSRFWLVRNPGGTVSLADREGRFVGIHWSRNVYADRDAIGDTERFRLITFAGGRVALKSSWGLVLSAQSDGIITITGGRIGDKEKFTMTELKSSGPEDPSLAPATPEGASVFSVHCGYQEGTGGPQGREHRAPVFVKLWEWNFPDIARECQEYLGPNGFDAVQVSPVVEHRQGHQWWTKYQPVSFGLNSRSGTAREFAAMVAACRAAGVEVIVDIILNHIASPCTEAWEPRAREGALAPCTGWNGSHYGNRRQVGARGWDAATPELFHHQPEDVMKNCEVSEATHWNCGDSDLRFCSCCRCDMYGMPDWNHSMAGVRDLMVSHLQELHDIGVTMLRIDAAIYTSVESLSQMINHSPWDYVYQEWWGERPVPDRTQFVGHYRDVNYRWRMAQPLGTQAPEEMGQLLGIRDGVEGLRAEHALYMFAYHDGRTPFPFSGIPTYKNGLEFHLQQRYFLAAPVGISVMVWGGFAWREMTDGPPGCEAGRERCTPEPVFDGAGRPRCMPTPTESPLRWDQAQSRQWVCEHRWAGVAGLVHFRKACRGLPQTVLAGARGKLAYRLGQSCFVALVRGYNRDAQWGHVGNWSLAGVATGLPSGRYCDLGSLPTRRGWDQRSCPREVLLGAGGAVLSGEVSEGNLLAIHEGARLLDP